MNVFVVEMLRYGGRENHSYIQGVYTTKEMAIYAGEVEQNWRGGNKYAYNVCEIVVDAPLDQEEVDWHEDCIAESRVVLPAPKEGVISKADVIDAVIKVRNNER